MLLRRLGTEVATLGRTAVLGVEGPFELILRAGGSHPTTLEATLRTADGRTFRASAQDAAAQLQRARGRRGAGHRPDPPPQRLPGPPRPRQPPPPAVRGPGGPGVHPNAGRAGLRRRDPAPLDRGFREIEIESAERPRPTRPSIVAATTGAPFARGARLHVASDVRAAVSIELSRSPRFKRKRTVRVGRTGEYEAVTRAVRRLPRGAAHLLACPADAAAAAPPAGPVRSFRVLPAAGRPGARRIAIASCAGQFGPIFDHLAARRPEVLVWQGDLNYPDTHGPLSQTSSGYAGIWREFLANPRLAPVLASGVIRRPARRPRLRDPGRELDEPPAVGALAVERADGREALPPLLRGAARRLGPQPAALQERPDPSRHAGQDAARAPPASWLLRTLAAREPRSS